jgi:soluble lytic murein transglycosylase-like protein
MFHRPPSPAECRRHVRARTRAAACLLAGMLPVVAPALGAQSIFQIGDMSEEIHLSDRADAPPGIEVRRLAGADVPAAGRRTPGPADRFTETVRSAAAAQRLAPELIEAVIAVESAWQVNAVSRRGAAGLMQLMPATARLYGVDDIFDPHQNIGAGARHLRNLLDRYGQDVGRALAAYNAGAGAVDRAAGQRRGWPNAETAAYVPDVLRRYAALVRQPPSPRATVAATP